MSGNSFGSYKESFGHSRDYSSEDEDRRLRAEEERSRRLRDDADRAAREAPRTVAKKAEPTRQHVDHRMAKNEITSPPASAKRLFIVLVDNSGSNREIAQALKRASGYIHAVAGTLSADVTIAFQFFSDHGDHERMIQEVDYTSPGERGSQALLASIDRVATASGQDEPEAIECALHKAAQYDFGSIPKERRHLILVTDQVAHGMGYPDGDDGCPDQRNWRVELRHVHEVYGTFQMVASGDIPQVFELQKQFIDGARLRADMLSMVSAGLTDEERHRLVPNTVLFFMARNLGIQTVETFLMTLVEKWMAEPQYGANTLQKARDRIWELCQYLEVDAERRQKIYDRVFAGLSDR